MSFGLFSLRYHRPATYKGLHAIRGKKMRCAKDIVLIVQSDLQKMQSG